jgi:hypothetical protein
MPSDMRSRTERVLRRCQERQAPSEAVMRQAAYVLAQAQDRLERGERFTGIPRLAPGQ